MAWMKYVAEVQQSDISTDNLRKAIASAEKYNLKYGTFQGELIKTEKLRAMLNLIDNNNDSIHREPDRITGVTE